MTDSLPRPDQTWSDAEALVERVEQAARSNVSPESFFDDLTSGLRLTSGASAVAILVDDLGTLTVLSRSGISIHDEIVDFDHHDDHRDHAPRGQWVDGRSHDGGRLLADQCVQGDVQLGLDLRFDQAVELAQRNRLCELVEVILDLAATVFIRSRLNDLRIELGHRSDRDALISKLNEGIALTDSFTLIASAIASEALVDRISLLRFRSPRYRLITSSTQPKVDRRARQARLLEKLTETALAHDDQFSFTVGSATGQQVESRPVLDGYLHESGCREIYIECVRNHDRSEPVAAIVLERFRIPTEEGRSIETLLVPIREPVGLAIRNAIRRDDAGWGMVVSRFASQTSRRNALCVAFGMCVLVVMACCVPATLKIPVVGRIVASKQSRLYAPAEGIVADVLVENGQGVSKGDALVILRSPDLDLQQHNLQGTLSTARTRLGSLLALRSRSGSVTRREQESNVSADEQVLKTEIEGLEKQLQLVQAQQESLTITSPIDGRVDRWDLEQSLTARPVTLGQHLLDVSSSEQGWLVELDLPEQNVNYVLEEQQLNACRCFFRLRSNPTRTHHGLVNEIADVAHLNPLGQSVVRVTLPIESEASHEFRTGATVLAQIHCGKRSLGFVWLRGLIQWYRSQAWF